MIWFKSKKDEKLKQLLKKSGSDFQFDSNPTKYRLLTSIEQADQKPAPRIHMGRVAKYSVSFATLVILISTTFAFASTSTPGDQLFALNKFGEQVVLHLPLSVEQKAKVETYIVTNRLKALDQVKTKSSQKNNSSLDARKLQTVEETDATFSSAIDQISQSKQALEARGETQSAAKLDMMLDDLQSMAEKREITIEALGNETTDFQIRAQYQTHLSQLKIARQKAQLNIKRFSKKPAENPQNQTPPVDDNSK